MSCNSSSLYHTKSEASTGDSRKSSFSDRLNYRRRLSTGKSETDCRPITPYGRLRNRRFLGSDETESIGFRRAQVDSQEGSSESRLSLAQDFPLFFRKVLRPCGQHSIDVEIRVRNVEKYRKLVKNWIAGGFVLHISKIVEKSKSGSSVNDSYRSFSSADYWSIFPGAKWLLIC